MGQIHSASMNMLARGRAVIIPLLMNRLWAVVLVATCVFLIYAGTLQNPFVYDDEGCVVSNTLVKDWKNIGALFSHDYFARASEATYRPVVTLSYFIDHSLHGLSPLGWHLTNITLHAANSALVYFLIRSLSGRPLVALPAALVFAVHPVNTQAVNSIGFREDPLGFFFFALSVVFFLRAEKHRVWALLSLAACAAAMLTKEMAATLPAVCLLALAAQDGAVRGRLRRHAVLLAGLTVVVTVIAAGGLYMRPSSGANYPGGTIISALMTSAKAVMYYLKIIVWPCGLTLDYGRFLETARLDWAAAGSIAAIAVLLGYSAAVRVRRPLVFFGVWYFFVTLLPALNILPVGHILAERYLYFSLPGAALLTGLGIAALGRRFGRVSAVILAGMLVVLFSARTVSQNRVWKTELGVWLDSAAHRPVSVITQYNLGVAYSRVRDFPRAIDALRRALAIDPGHRNGWANLVDALGETGDYAGAAVAFARGSEIAPDHPLLFKNMGGVLLKSGDARGAELMFARWTELEPGNAEACYQRGLAQRAQGMNDAAAASYRRAISLDPAYAQAYNNLGTTLIAIGDYRAALTFLERAASLDHGLAQARNNMGICFLALNDPGRAVAAFRAALEINGGLADAWRNLGIALQGQGAHAGSAAAFRRFLMLVPQDAQAPAMREYIARYGRASPGQEQ